MPPDHTRNNFDFLRFIAATMVVFSHGFALKGLPEPRFLKYQSVGGLGVLIFFSISGYLIAQSWDRDPNLIRFTARRLLRIWPGLAVIVVVAVFALGPWVTSLSRHSYFSNPLTWKYFSLLAFQNQVYLPGAFSGNAWPNLPNGALWTIPLEVHCYAAVAVCGVLGVLRSRYTVLALFAGLSIYYYGVHRAQYLFESTHALRAYQLEYGAIFLAGAMFHYFDGELLHVNRFKTLAFVYAAAIAAITVNQELFAALLIVPITTICIGSASTPVLRSFGRYGDLSYGIYIWGFPIQQTVIWLSHNRMSYLATVVLSYSLVLIAAFLSWHCIEKPALRLKPRAVRRTEDRQTSLENNAIAGIYARQEIPK